MAQPKALAWKNDRSCLFLLFSVLAFSDGAHTRFATQEPDSVVVAALSCLVLAVAQELVIVAALVENLRG